MHIAVVVPRYGRQVLGGAESQARGFAEEAVRQGWKVEVWTTCALEHYTWQNDLPPGDEMQNGVRVRRFPVSHREPGRQAALDVALSVKGSLPLVDQYKWLECGPHSPALYHHIRNEADHFDVLVALPYASQLCHYAAWSAPERTVLWPCLHDEPYAYMEPTRLLIETVWGVMFNSPEERTLAVQALRMKPQRHTVLGEGVTLSSSPSHSPDQYRDLLYMGRLEGGKNLSLLYDYVRRYVDEGGRLCLHVLGKGPEKPPEHPAFVYHGFVPEAEKALRCASTLALCQPSLNESFSLTIMESWLAGRPVLVHGDCAVTVGHVRRSRGGLWFRAYADFAGAVEWLRGNPTQAKRMGRNGRTYVNRNYTWEAVLGRFQQTVDRWKSAIADNSEVAP